MKSNTVNAPNSRHTEIRYYTPPEFTVNHSYQRDLRRAWVNKLKAEFDPRLLGALAVALIDGQPHLVDGQHRCAAMLELGEPWTSRAVPCITFVASSIEEAAYIFEGLQRTLRMRTYDRFKATLLAGDPGASEIARIVHDCGCRLSLAMGAPSSTCAISALSMIYNDAGLGLKTGPWPILLGATIRTIRDAFPCDHALTQVAIVGIGRFLHHYGDHVSAPRLSERLRKDYGGYQKFYEAAKAGVPRPWRDIKNAVPHVCVISYNAGLRTKHLAPWTI